MAIRRRKKTQKKITPVIPDAGLARQRLLEYADKVEQKVKMLRLIRAENLVYSEKLIVTEQLIKDIRVVVKDSLS